VRGKVVPAQVRSYRNSLKAQFCSLLTSAMVGVAWSLSSAGRFIDM